MKSQDSNVVEKAAQKILMENTKYIRLVATLNATDKKEKPAEYRELLNAIRNLKRQNLRFLEFRYRACQSAEASEQPYSQEDVIQELVAELKKVKVFQL